MLWGASVYQLCSKGLITRYKTPADWTAAVLYQFHIFDPEKGEDFTKKKNRIDNNTTQKKKLYILKELKKNPTISSLRDPMGQLFSVDLSIIISAKS